MDKGGKNKIFSVLFALVAIAIGLITIVKLVGIAELAVGAISLTFGLMAIFWTVKARKSLSPGSELRKYTTYFLLSLISILLFSLWDTFLGIFGFRESLSRAFIYPKFFFITLSYFIFLKAAYEILYISRNFGFEVKAQEIKAVMQEKKGKTSPLKKSKKKKSKL